MRLLRVSFGFGLLMWRLRLRLADGTGRMGRSGEVLWMVGILVGCRGIEIWSVLGFEGCEVGRGVVMRLERMEVFVVAGWRGRCEDFGEMNGGYGFGILLVGSWVCSRCGCGLVRRVD